MPTYSSSMLPQVIYVFSTDYPLHKGCLKIGMTKLTEDCKQLPAPNDPLLIAAARERIDQYTKTAAIKYELLYTECSAFIHKGVLQSFDDKQVHSVLLRSGIRRPDFSNEGLGKEWFETDLATVKNAISAAKEGRSSLFPEEKTQNEPAPIVFRPEQREAIDKAVKHFTKNKGKGQRKMLWNCKMRFGKTLSALQVVREMGARRTLIVTHRPVVNAGWYEDFEKIFYDLRAAEPVADGSKGAGAAKKGELQGKYNYGSAQKGERLDQLLLQADEGAHIVCFASLQDLRGSEDVGGKHEKNDNIFATDWDLLIVDEAHEGTQTELGQAVIDQLRHADTKVLQLSGTPFNLFDQYDEDEIFTWDYIMEQRAKTSWDEYHVGDSNPYASLPAMHIYTYDLGRLMNRFADEDKVFNFREFFRTDEQSAFVYDNFVGDFLDLLCCDDEDSLYPYAKADFRRIFRHTLWVLPGVKAARALSKKLQAHPVFGAFTVVNVAGEGDADEESRDALEKVNKAIGKDPSATYTITLSCGRLTTGVSIRPWTGVFLLAGSSSTSAAGYMQTIFRVQTPFEYQGRVKENCYAFDFAPDRALRMLAEASKVSYKAGKQTAEDRHTLADFLHFCPVIALEGSKMKAFNVDNLLTQLKRVQIERVVNAGFEDGALYNDELLRLEDADVADFNGLRAKIGTTKALKPVDKVKVSDNGLDGNNAQPPAPSDKKPSKESDPEAAAQKALENERKKQRKNAIAILRGISIRMPLLIYGADLHDEAVELTIDNFVHLIDDTSWTEFMPAGVTKADFARFKRYYDPEVFSAAGRRIRQLARSADKFTIEERISRLTALFSTFRNPDKETVLTPWRVVNLHLSDSLGGYCFMDERFEHPLETPRHIVRSGVTDRVFSPRSTVLEINSKSGLYPLYAAYSIYRSRLDEEGCKHNAIAPDRAKALWEQTLKENIFVVCKTPMAVAITKRTLCGFNAAEVNAKYYPDLIQCLTHSPQTVIRNLRDAKGFWGLNDKKEMKIDAIIGNPPYQVTSENTSDAPVYHLFIDLASLLAQRVSLLTPARYLFNAGKTPKEWNTKILNDEHFKVVAYWANSTDVFPTVIIKGGVAVMYRDSKQVFGKIGTFTAYAELTSIANKVTSPLGRLSDIVYPQNKFDLEEVYNQCPDAREIIGSNGTERRLTTPIFKQLTLFCVNQTEQNSYKILGLIDNKRCYRWIDKRYIETHPNLEKYKVIVPKSNGSGAIGEVLSTPLIGEPLIGVTQSFLTIGAFDTQAEAESCLKYVKTKFVRTMLGILKATQDNPKDTWRLVPLQDFTSASDIDWTQEIEQIDRQLYRKYGLTPQEIAFIEEKVIPMQ